jgi:hypothetical protein
VNDGLVFAHNMTIHPCKPDENNNPHDKSDTRIFNEQILQLLPDGWLRNVGILAMMSEFIGRSRLVFLDDAGHLSFVNGEKGEWGHGIWYSNDSYKAKEVKVEPWKAADYPLHDGIAEIRKDPEAPVCLTGKEYRADGLVCKWNIYEQASQAWDYDKRVWRVYDSKEGRFAETPYSCKRHTPMAHKSYFATWKELQELAAAIEAEDTSRTTVIQFPSPVRIRCEQCGRYNNAGDVHRAVIQIQSKNASRTEQLLLCGDCIQFHVEMDTLVRVVCTGNRSVVNH